MENIWRRGPIERNPYEWTAFHVTGVPPDVVSRRSVNQMIEASRRVIQRAAGQRRIGGEPIEEADVNWGRDVLLDTNRRITEELLVHKAETIETSELARFDSAFKESDEGEIRSLEFLELLAESLARSIQRELERSEILAAKADPRSISPTFVGGNSWTSV